MAAMGKVTIYTDGSCIQVKRSGTGYGGWAALLENSKKTKEICGGVEHATSNRMELTAALMALQSLKRPCKVTLFTDSEYLKNGMTSWLGNWKRNGWRASTGRLVKNEDLWKQLDALAQDHEIEWQWIKGHSGNVKNARVDALAREAARQYAFRR